MIAENTECTSIKRNAVGGKVACHCGMYRVIVAMSPMCDTYATARSITGGPRPRSSSCRMQDTSTQ